jgi:putative hydrolase of the HAD superfamily
VTTHLLFDFFGTLVEYSASRTEQGYERTFDLLRNAGTDLDYDTFLSLWTRVSSEFDDAAGRSHREFSMVELASAFLNHAVSSVGEPFVHEFVATYISEWNSGVRYIDGVAELLERLSRDFTLSIITNTHDRELVPRHLRRMGVAPLFREVVTSVDFGIRKPAAGIFEHAIGLLGVSAADCIYVGDNFEADYVGARSAGISAFLIDPTNKAEIDPEDRLESIFEIERNIGRRT